MNWMVTCQNELDGDIARLLPFRLFWNRAAGLLSLPARSPPSHCWAGTGRPRRHWAGANWAKRPGHSVGAVPAARAPRRRGEAAPPAGAGARARGPNVNA